MKTVLVSGNTLFKCTCHQCGCKFTYEVEDIKTAESTSENLFGSLFSGGLEPKQVSCPQCGYWNTHRAIAVKKEDNIGVSTNQTD